MPERLLVFLNQLLEIAPEDQSIPYDYQNWEHFFHDDPDFLEVTQMFPNVVTRGHIKNLAIEALDNQANHRRFFLATMVWGYGTRGFGPFRTSQMLGDPGALHMIQMAINGIAAGQILNVYEQFRLRFCGPAFFTKFFYFIGLGCAVNPLPLIFDSRVANSFRVLVADMGLNFSDFAVVQQDAQGQIVAVSRYPEGYVHFVNLVNHWAHELGCRSDSIELFLFDPPGAFWEWHNG